ncbi:MAG TPA: DNA repair protein RadA [Patescibacteria group bacterium]
MAKTQVSFVCQECGYDSPQWLGKCPECGNWNSFKEFRENKAIAKLSKQSTSSFLTPTDTKPKTLQEITFQETNRILSGFDELDTVLGGGIVPGSVTLLAGDPGIGKSTLLLQLCLLIAASGKKVLYVSGEESVEQIKLRASRIKNALENKNLFLISLSDTDAIVSIIEQEKPSLVIIDSIQTMESKALDGMSGSVGQVRFAATTFIKAAKTLGIPVILVGHVTKEGMVAGPMVLSHMVDTVLFLEGEKFTKTRILRSLKNRFGPVDEVGVFLMDATGMQEVKNPEQLFLTQRESQVPGSVLVVIMEGTRPFLIEIQALVVYSKLAMPRRVANGVDHKRVELLLAVLQKQCRLQLDSYDVFVNVAGGLKVSDPAVDLGICLAVYSSLKNKPLQDVVGIAEVGLLGELREVGGLDKRMREAKKLGLKTVLTSKSHKTLNQALLQLGFSNSNLEKTWQQQDERHFKVEKEE